MSFEKTIRKVSGFVAGAFPMNVLISVTGQKLILPFYHAVSDRRLPHLANVIETRDIKTFKADLEFFLRNFKPLDAMELVKMVAEKTGVRKPSFHLSFDDGLKEAVTIIAPLLKEMGIPSTFFVNTGFIGNQMIFYRFKASILIENMAGCTENTLKKIGNLLETREIKASSLREQLLSVSYDKREILDEIASLMQVDFQDYTSRHEIYLNAEDIIRLIRQGFTIGAHSTDHPEFRTLEPAARLAQTNGSILHLQNSYGVTLQLFSFPFSDEGLSDGDLRRICKPEGIADLSFGISGLKKDSHPRHLHRIPMETGNATAREIIKGEYLYYIVKSFFNRNRIVRK